jgi:hypothetical protein
MSVSDGQPVDAAVVNAAFISRTQDTSTVGKLALQNPEPESGPAISNPQRAINEAFDVSGIAGLGDPNAKNYSSTNVVSNGMNRKEAIEALDAEVGSIGSVADEYPLHTHDGVNTPQISAASLLDINQLEATWQADTVVGASGFSSNINALFAAKNDGLGGTQLGVITLPPYNKVLLFDPVTGTNFEDVDGTRVFGRVTFDTVDWVITYFTNKAGVETPYEFSSPVDVQFFYLEVFNLATRPTVPNTPDFFTLDVTADVVDASATQRGVVNTSAQTFAGVKTFQDGVVVGGENLSQSLEERVRETRVVVSYLDFAVMAQTAMVNIKLLAAGEKVHRIMIKPSVEFLGLSELFASVGSSLDKEKYASKYNVLGSVNNDHFQHSIGFGFEDLDNSANLVLHLEGDSNLDLLSAGVLQVYIWSSVS